jgi:acyl-homoserine-lactone acylase
MKGKLHLTQTIDWLCPVFMKNFSFLGLHFCIFSFAVVALSERGFSQFETALAPWSSELGRENACEILWDQYGIPHIYGPDLLAVVRGYGYAQMENHAELILQKVAEARGRAAEYFGPGAQNANVENDLRIQTYGIPERAQRWYREGGSFQQSILQAFVSGLNQYANQFADSIDQTLCQVLPIEPEDVLAIIQDTIHFTFLPETSNVPDLIAAWNQNQIASVVQPVHSRAKLGSNGWALAPARTKNGNAILMGNPHLPWGGEPTLAWP